MDSNEQQTNQQMNNGANEQANPQQSAASAPPAAPQQAPQKPGEISEKDKANVIADRKKQAAKKHTLTWLLLGFVGLVVVFGGLALFLLSQGTAETNPLLKMLGIEAINKEAIFLTVTNIIFGIVIFITFIVAIVNFFKAMVGKKDPAQKKRHIIWTSAFGILFIILLFAWAFTYIYLAQFVKQTNKPQARNFVTVPAEPINLTAPVTIEFDASPLKVDPKRYTILSYSWDFGDKKTGNGEVTKHTYESKGSGEYEVTLVIKLLDKKTNKTIESPFKKTITIQNEKVRAMFSADPEKGDAPLTVKFDASESKDPDGEILSYEWDFDADNNFSDASGKEVEHTFEQVGEYDVTLRVTDNNSESDTVTKKITVESKNKADAVIEIEGTPDTLGKDVSYAFSAAKSNSKEGPIQTYEWNFGDGSRTEKGRLVNHTYKKEGTYEIELVVTDNKGNKGTTTMKVSVGKKPGAPKAVITTTPELKNGIVSGTVPLTVTFDASDSTDSDDNIVEYQWDFDGDGNIDKRGVRATYTYGEKGSFDVKLNVVDADKNSSQTTIVAKVFSSGLQAKLEADPIDGRVPMTVQLDASGSSYKEGKIVSYEWDFGDGSEKVIGEATINHEYSKIGTFEAKVTAIASDGKRAEALLNITVRPVPLQACFSVNNRQGPAPLIVTFEPRCSTGPIDEYLWSFGYENAQSRVRKPVHTFEQPGTYEVILQVKDKNNVVSTFTETVVVTGGN